MQRQIGSRGWREVAATAVIQGGRVSRAQLIALGLGPGAIDHRVRVGWLHVRQRGVYAVGSPAETADGRWWEALLAYGEEAALSHASAATVQELQRLRPGPVELTSPRSGIADRPGIRVRRSWVLLPHEVTQRRGIRVTTPATDHWTSTSRGHLLAGSRTRVERLALDPVGGGPWRCSNPSDPRRAARRSGPRGRCPRLRDRARRPTRTTVTRSRAPRGAIPRPVRPRGLPAAGGQRAGRGARGRRPLARRPAS